MFNYSMFFYFKNIPADIREINGPQSSRVIRKINRDFGSKCAALSFGLLLWWSACNKEFYPNDPI